MNLYSKQLSIFFLAVVFSVAANAQFSKNNDDPDADEHERLGRAVRWR